MERGKVSMFDGGRGFGFIRPYHGGPSVFFHIGKLEPVGVAPEVGDEIDFEVEKGPRGYAAVNATLVESRAR